MAIDLLELMKRYARQGIADWDKAPALAKQKASIALGNKVADNEWQAFNTIETNLKGVRAESCLFIPMPNVNHDSIKHCFFLPIRIPAQKRMAFDLFLFIDDDKCLGFRFEPADPPDRAHGYGHVQMNCKMCKNSLVVKGIPDWLPDSYPAFPIRTSDPLQMFLSMATSVHGYGGGMIRVLQEVFKDRPNDMTDYLEALKGALH